MEKKNYQNDKKFLQQYLNIIELELGEQKLLVSPDLQGRVLTSTAAGDEGYSFGWLNYDLIASGKHLPHCNNWGGEDRFWLGPEGGQFSLFFRKGSSFTFEEWQTPAVIDTEAWQVLEQTPTQVKFCKDALLENYAGTRFSCRLERTVVLSECPADNLPEGVKAVCFYSENRLTNTGDFEWTRETGMPSIWILGQFIPSDRNTIYIPYCPYDKVCINDRYFGKIGIDRLKMTDGRLFFKADGKKRGKIGIPPEMAENVACAYDAENGILTMVFVPLIPTSQPYVNSMWEYQQEPFSGDAVNAYNDGPLEDGSIMGPFYELETSSPAAALKPGESISHAHITFHYTGAEESLNHLARRKLRLDLKEINLD